MCCSLHRLWISFARRIYWKLWHQSFFCLLTDTNKTAKMTMKRNDIFSQKKKNCNVCDKGRKDVFYVNWWWSFFPPLSRCFLLLLNRNVASKPEHNWKRQNALKSFQICLLMSGRKNWISLATAAVGVFTIAQLIRPARFLICSWDFHSRKYLFSNMFTVFIAGTPKTIIFSDRISFLELFSLLSFLLFSCQRQQRRWWTQKISRNEMEGDHLR